MRTFYGLLHAVILVGSILLLKQLSSADNRLSLQSYCQVSFPSPKKHKQALIAFHKQGIEPLLGVTLSCKSPCSALQTKESSKEAFLQSTAALLKKYQGKVEACTFVTPASNGNEDPNPIGMQAPRKPVIYLYPPKAQEVLVQLDYQGRLVSHYPTYDPALHGWRVLASPEGVLFNLADRREYGYLFWEGFADKPISIDRSYGFMVPGSETVSFLQKTLAELGLTDREANEFIVYWLPYMERNPYNFIQFVGKAYTDTASLTITPKPDSLLRVFMVFQRVDVPFPVTPQQLSPFERKGFVVVEWGGSELQNQ